MYRSLIFKGLCLAILAATVASCGGLEHRSYILTGPVKSEVKQEVQVAKN